jgi:hypothetical protein
MTRILVRLLLALSLLPFASFQAGAQQPNPLAGSWTLVSDTMDPAGRKSATLGQSPHGTLIFGSDGRYALVMSRAGLPRFVSNNRERGTDDENRAVVAGSLAHAGRYSVDERNGTFTWQVESSTFPNWNRTSQTRSFKITGEQLRYVNPSSTSASGTTLEAVWRRAK